MRRREFIAVVGGAAVVAWPLAAGAQQAERVRHIDILMNVDDADLRSQHAAFLQFLKELGWTDGRNVQIDTRWAKGPADIPRYVTELAALAPDVIVITGTAAMSPMLEATRTVPIVFVNVADPIGAGYVRNMAHPGGNVTGFVQFEYSLSGKWSELLKQIAPDVTRIAVLRDPTITSGIGQFAVIESVAPSLGMDVTAIDMRDAQEIERDIAAFAQSPHGGLILTASAMAVTHRELVIALAAKYKLPTVYYRRHFADAGGLISYGYNVLQEYRGIAGYVDRILKGEKPGDLPVQAPNKYELIINLKTAKAIGLAIPESFLLRADEVIE
ncbi:MAG: ABC transporter substrate-binding protein [Xanthobacteraceae bacterium]